MSIKIERQSTTHAAGLFDALSDERTYEFLDERPPTDVGSVRARIERLSRGAPEGTGEVWLNWTVFSDGKVVGYTQATIERDGTADLAYVLHPGAWGRSIGYRACELTIEALAAHSATRRVVADTDHENQRSQTLLGRLGFAEVRREGRDVFYELTDE